jgi:hypothetical protein
LRSVTLSPVLISTASMSIARPYTLQEGHMRIIGRPTWRARRPRPRQPQNPRSVRELFIHWPGADPHSWAHVDTRAEERATMRAIQDFHMGPERKWSDFAYSFAIFKSGRVYRGRGMNWVPASQLDHNTGTVSVCVFVGPDDPVPDVALRSIKELRAFCERKAGHVLDVRPHSSVTGTECPGPRLLQIANRL